MEEIKQDKVPEEPDGKENKALEEEALDDKALEEASGGLVYPKFLKQWF